ncbi:MAG: glutamate--tRNA ligase [Nitriliruptoraceae bacterium]
MAEKPLTSPVRVRFCPAPSGWLHVGSVRAALYNWLVARQHAGTFIFRIEDTDATRATEESMRSMMEALEWIGLDWDEGPTFAADGTLDSRGAYGPYRQSERHVLYQAVAQRLEARHDVYRDYRTSEELDAWRASMRTSADGNPPVVKAAQFAHSEDELAAYAQEGRTYSLRLRTPDTGQVIVNDLVRGEITFQWENIADPVIIRSDGSATYPLANATDDVAQGVSLICRGEDLLSVTPRQIVLYDLLVKDGLIDDALAAVNFPAREADWEPPRVFAHLPMVVGMDRKKLSKRHGSVALQEFRKHGFLPETLRNYLALLGWAPKDGRERLNDDELIAEFDLNAVGRSAAAFDVDKLAAFNGERIRGLGQDELAERLLAQLSGADSPDIIPLIKNPPSDDERQVVRKLVPLVQERMQQLDEVLQYAPPFLSDVVTYDPASVAKVLAKEGTGAVLETVTAALAEVSWDAEALEAALRATAQELGMGFGKLAQPVRVAVTGTTVSPPLFDTLELLGREVSRKRLNHALTLAG